MSNVIALFITNKVYPASYGRLKTTLYPNKVICNASRRYRIHDIQDIHKIFENKEMQDTFTQNTTKRYNLKRSTQ